MLPLDHLPFRAKDLDRLQAAFEAIGFTVSAPGATTTAQSKTIACPRSASSGSRVTQRRGRGTGGWPSTTPRTRCLPDASPVKFQLRVAELDPDRPEAGALEDISPDALAVQLERVRPRRLHPAEVEAHVPTDESRTGTPRNFRPS